METRYTEGFVGSVPHAFKDRDIRRLVKATEAATGRKVVDVSVNPKTGEIKVVTAKSGEVSGAPSNEWDEVLEPNGADQAKVHPRVS
jgi:hypothetical protein